MAERNDTVTEVIDGRRGVYGDPRENIRRTALVWSGITGADIQPHMVPLMLMGYKEVRAAYTPDYSDNSDDIEGYLDMFREYVGPDMIHARSVSEYLEEVERRRRVENAQGQQDLMSAKLDEAVSEPSPASVDPGFRPQYDSKRAAASHPLPGDYEKASQSWGGSSHIGLGGGA